MLTGLRDYEFRICIYGTEWEDKWSFGAKKATIIKAAPLMKREYSFMNLFSYEDVNVQSLMFRNEGVFKSFTCPRNFTFGRAIAMWNLNNLDFPPFEYLLINGRRISNYEYNMETIDFWNWNQMFVIVNSLKCGGVIDQIPKECLSIVEGILNMIVGNTGKEKFRKELDEGNREAIDLSNYFWKLEQYGIMAHEDDDYWTWYIIRHEAICVIVEIDEAMNDFQNVIDRSMKQDLNLFVSLSSLMYLNELD
jgi:hypothetical protein